MKLQLFSKKGFPTAIKDIYLETLLPRFKEERIGAFLTLSLTLLTITIFGLFAINPTLTTITQLRKTLDDNKFVFRSLEEKKANLIALQQNYTQIQPDFPLILDAVPVLPDIPPFIAQLQAVAAKTNVEILNIQTLPVEFSANAPVSSYMSFTFSLTVKGSLTRINTFITSLQSFNRLVTLDEFALIKTPENPDSFQFTAKGKTYFKKI